MEKMSQQEILDNMDFDKIEKDFAEDVDQPIDGPEFRALKQGLLHAINGTYRKGINPEGAEPMRLALEKMINVLETRGNNFPIDRALPMLKTALGKALLNKTTPVTA